MYIRAFLPKFAPILLFIITLNLIFINKAHSDHSVNLVEVSDSSIQDGECPTIEWNIECDDGTYDWWVEVEGDGTQGSGNQCDSSDCSGSSLSCASDTISTICSSDLTSGDGSYSVYIITENTSDSTDTAYASTSITLDNPPDAPTGLEVESGEGKLFVEWDSHPDSDIDYFNLYYDTVPYSLSSSYANVVNAGDDTDHTLSNLENDITYYLAITAVDESGNESGLSGEVSGTPREVQGLVGLNNAEGGCFIVTAVYGSSDAEEVKIMKEFRDKYLKRYKVGREFITLYYKYSPGIAKYISQNSYVRFAIKGFIVPVVLFAEFLLSTSQIQKVIVLLLIVLVLFYLLWRPKGLCYALSRTRLHLSKKRFFMVIFLLIFLVYPLIANADSSKKFTFEMIAGPYYPDEIEQFKTIYGNAQRAQVHIGVGWQFLQKYGIGEIQGSLGYFHTIGKGVAVETGESTGEEFIFYVAPAQISLIYRFDYIKSLWVVPFIKGGVNNTYWREDQTHGDKDEDGALWGYHYGGGIQIPLDWIEPRHTAYLKMDWGIDHTYLVAEYRVFQIDDFGDEEIIDLSEATWFAGFLFEF